MFGKSNRIFSKAFIEGYLMGVVVGAGYDSDTLHKYMCASGNPVKYNDPSGNFFSLGEMNVTAGI